MNFIVTESKFMYKGYIKSTKICMSHVSWTPSKFREEIEDEFIGKYSFFRLVHFGDRVYDPVLGQWMTPGWETLVNNMVSPFNIFSYRYINNNPYNPTNNRPLHQADTHQQHNGITTFSGKIFFRFLYNSQY